MVNSSRRIERLWFLISGSNSTQENVGGITFLYKINCLPVYMASYSESFESSVTPLWEFQTFHTEELGKMSE